MNKIKKVIETKKDEDGDIISVKFEGNQQFTSSEKAMEMIDNGWELEGIHIVNNQNGIQEKNRWLRSNRNSDTKDNLDNL